MTNRRTRRTAGIDPVCSSFASIGRPFFGTGSMNPDWMPVCAECSDRPSWTAMETRLVSTGCSQFFRRNSAVTTRRRTTMTPTIMTRYRRQQRYAALERRILRFWKNHSRKQFGHRFASYTPFARHPKRVFPWTWRWTRAKPSVYNSQCSRPCAF